MRRLVPRRDSDASVIEDLIAGEHEDLNSARERGGGKASLGIADLDVVGCEGGQASEGISVVIFVIDAQRYCYYHCNYN